MYESVRHALLLGKQETLHLAPVSARGKILEEMGSGGVALALRAELVSITEILQSVLGDRPAPYFAPAAGRDTGYYLVGLRQEAPIPGTVHERHEFRVRQEIVLNEGMVSIPISALTEAMVALLGVLPNPFRALYNRSAIKVSMVASGKQTRLTVHLAGEYASRLRWWHVLPFTTSRNKSHSESNPMQKTTSEQPVVFSTTRSTTTLDEVAELMRDAAFMVLYIHGSFRGRNWWSMRCLLDGLGKLEEYRRTGTPESRESARKCFHSAAVADPINNHEALYYHGVMTMVERTAEAIGEAQRYFETALEGTRHPQLRALLHTGVAYCYAQQFHRLAKLNPEVLREAESHAKKAETEWFTTRDGALKPEQPHPLIPYTYALVGHVDEGSAGNREERIQRFARAAKLYRQAIDLQNDNGMFYNNLAWTLLKLAEWEEQEVPADLADCLVTDTTERCPAPLAEYYCQSALGLNPNNKLTHSNLCLLYSTSWFRDHSERNFLNRCRYHGLKAIRLDNEYINGHRDLAVALVRYGNLDEAYGHYTTALELAEHPDKDEEIVHDLDGELKGYQERTGHRLSDGEMKRWRKPDRRLFEPRKHSQ